MKEKELYEIVGKNVIDLIKHEMPEYCYRRNALIEFSSIVAKCGVKALKASNIKAMPINPVPFINIFDDRTLNTLNEMYTNPSDGGYKEFALSLMTDYQNEAKNLISIALEDVDNFNSLTTLRIKCCLCVVAYMNIYMSMNCSTSLVRETAERAEEAITLYQAIINSRIQPDKCVENGITSRIYTALDCTDGEDICNIDIDLLAYFLITELNDFDYKEITDEAQRILAVSKENIETHSEELDEAALVAYERMRSNFKSLITIATTISERHLTPEIIIGFKESDNYDNLIKVLFLFSEYEIKKTSAYEQKEKISEYVNEESSEKNELVSEIEQDRIIEEWCKLCEGFESVDVSNLIICTNTILNATEEVYLNEYNNTVSIISSLRKEKVTDKELYDMMLAALGYAENVKQSCQKLFELIESTRAYNNKGIVYYKTEDTDILKGYVSNLLNSFDLMNDIKIRLEEDILNKNVAIADYSKAKEYNV